MSLERFVRMLLFGFSKIAVRALKLFASFPTIFVLVRLARSAHLSACFLKNFAEAIQSLPNFRPLHCSIFCCALQ
jgi:hypothetical protein